MTSVPDLRARMCELDTASVFTPADGDIADRRRIAGPVILAAPQSDRQPEAGRLRLPSGALGHEVRTGDAASSSPTCCDGSARTVPPLGTERGTVGTVEAHLDKKVDPERRSRRQRWRAVPYTVNERTPCASSPALPGTIRLQAGDREIAYSLTLPDVGEAQWTVPARCAAVSALVRIQDTPGN